jgi:tripartite-type tricarboxylate transporter receptor subunit TctC
VPYSVERDFQPLARFNASQNVLVVRSTLPVASVRELIEYARKNPGKLSYASSGSGTTVHLSAELFQQLTGTKLLHVPYKSSAQATADVLGGQVDLMFDNLSGIGPQLKTGKVRALGVTGPARSAAFPDLPTIAEAGVAKYEVTTWGGLLAPAGLPKAMVARLNAEILKACASASLKERLASIGNQCIGGTPQQFDAFIRSELARWSDVVRRSGAKAE